MKPIYVPSGKAKEYGDYAINIYTGCSHECFYCFAPSVLRKDKERFHSCVEPREGIVEAVRQQLKRENITGRTIHLCFTCDPYPMGCDTTATREIIRAIKDAGCHVQILTKNGRDAMRDFDLLDESDWFGVTYAGYTNAHTCAPAAEPNAGTPVDRMIALQTAHERGIRTWVSVEPVLDAEDALNFIRVADYVDLWKVGKMNYHPSDIDWKKFGENAVTILEKKGTRYYVKEGLRAEMEHN